MALVPWKDNLGINIQDHLGADIQFRSTAAQINAAFAITPTMSVRKPMGSVNINVSFIIDAPLSVKVFMSARIISSWNINPSSGDFVGRWTTIIAKNIGDKIYNG